MTVSNLFLQPERARLVSDTVGYIGKKPAVLHRKLRVAPGAGVAFVHRGRVWLSDRVAADAPNWTGFEHAIFRATTILVAVPAELVDSGSELTLVGFQDGAARAACLVTRHGPRANTCLRSDLTAGAYLGPSLGQHHISADLTDDQLVKVALLQQEIAVKHGLNLCVGGDVEVAEVTAAGVAIRTLGEYPDKAQTAARTRSAGPIAALAIAA